MIKKMDILDCLRNFCMRFFSEFNRNPVDIWIFISECVNGASICFPDLQKKPAKSEKKTQKSKKLRTGQ